MNRKPIFDAMRSLLGRSFSDREVESLDAAIDRALGIAASAGLALGARGKALIRKWEGCGRKRADGLFEAYPDPGSADGRPWTIGWGSTGADIGKGLVWSQAECDARFDQEIAAYAAEVTDALGGAPATQGQFDALVSFHYNTGAIGKATLAKLHKAGAYAEAAKEFANWIYNDGKPMAGLKKRREEEAALYLSA